MPAVRLAFDVPDTVALYAAGFTQIKVERCTGGTPPVWTEISRSTTRIPLRDVVERYYYSDPNGSPSYDYQAVFYNPTTGLDDPTELEISEVEPDALATLTEIRAEGVTVAEADDARVTLALEWASRYIERATRRLFGPRFGIQVFDVPQTSDTLLLPEPLIAILAMESGGAAVDLTTLEIYNRHLRGGDRGDLSGPQLKIADDLESDLYNAVWGDLFAFDRGSQAVRVTGIWGYTEASRGAIPGETADGSQVPLDYGVIPPLVNWACRALTLRHLFPMYTADEMTARARQVVSLSTRDQSVTFSAAAAAASTGWAADDAVQEVLFGYARVLSLGSP
jgi:hypothetical protein